MLEVKTAHHSYPIDIGSGNLSRIQSFIPHDASSIIVVSNPTVFGLYGETLMGHLKTLDKPVVQHLMPDGEQYKNLQSLNDLYTTMLEHHLDRHSVLLALGGGVVGDLAGFAAATYMRGIRFIQIPTTILAQVDSSVGGKTAVNHPLGKNMIGAFYQPIGVLIDIDVLQTLDPRQISAGLAEVIKYGFIDDADFVTWCEQHSHDLIRLDPSALLYAITHSCRTKAKIVGADEKEKGQRALLNLGHTFGHAIEAGLGFGQWLHGEAVACGMYQAAYLSHLLGHLSWHDVHRVQQLIQAIKGPTVAPQMPIEQWFNLMAHDKKTIGHQIRYVLLKQLGQAYVAQADPQLVTQTISFTMGQA